MHIEPGLVDGTKIVLSYATAAVSVGLIARGALQAIRQEGGVVALAGRSLLTSLLVLTFFEILPHQPVGVSEVHLILGSTLFLIFGGGAASIGLALGLLTQGLFFEPQDLPQYGMNLTTLIVPLYAMAALAGRIIPKATAYKDIAYAQALKLSTAYQGGIVAWVAFWAVYGHGFRVENLGEIAAFGGAYMTVILVEPLVDLAVLAAAKALARFKDTGLAQPRVYAAA